MCKKGCENQKKVEDHCSILFRILSNTDKSFPSLFEKNHTGCKKNSCTPVCLRRKSQELTNKIVHARAYYEKQVYYHKLCVFCFIALQGFADESKQKIAVLVELHP